MRSRALRGEKTELTEEIHLVEEKVLGSPAPFIAFALAMVGGALLASSNYTGGAVSVAIALILFGAWRIAEDRGDDDRHTIW